MPNNVENFVDIGDILQTDSEAPLEILRAIPQNGFFPRYLNKVRKGKDKGTLATHSYRHENGFSMLVLGSYSNGRFKLRAHYWPAENRNIESNVHNHRFGFTSRIVHGELEHTIYQAVKTGRKFKHFKYAPTSTSTNYVLEYLGSTFLREISRQ